jgi:hypothetical protein
MQECYQRLLRFRSSPTYDWLNRIVSVASGRRENSGPVYEVYEVL